jgi:DNA-binding response OmpR family regulator
MRILIVEDDRRLAQQLKKGLDEHGHLVTLAFAGDDGLEAALQGGFEVLVLDVMLPGMDGFSIVRKLRAARIVTPILLLTARDSAEDVVVGLDAGADDYLTKPFPFKILLARLRALARRRTVEPDTQLQIGDLTLNPATYELHRGDVPINLTRREYLLAEALLRNAGRVVTRSRLTDAGWGSDREIENNTLDVYMRMLRHKIDLPGKTRLIHTIRGVGYTMREEES